MIAAVAILAAPQWAAAHDELPAHHKVLPSTATAVMKAFFANERTKLPLTSSVSATSAPAATCVGGFANAGNGDAPYPCLGVDLQSFLALDDIGGAQTNSEANDIWGWTAPGGREYAIIGRVFGTSFVDISDPVNPVYLGDLPTHGAFGSSWRDIKVYQNRAYIVSEALNHGMQVFDLTQLLDPAVVAAAPNTFTETAHYNRAASSHNLHINEDSGFAYMVGNSGKNSCSGGLHMVNLANPNNPRFAGCYSGDGYTHDVQCVNYAGPDTDHQGREICFASNEDTVTIVDVTNKSNPSLIARMGYPGASYTHQGWLSGDHAFFIFDDELDERNGVVTQTTTRIVDVSDLDNPALSDLGASNGDYGADGVYSGNSTSIDHNLYMVGGCAVQANYRSGLRIVDLRDAIGAAPSGVEVSEIGFFDIWPANDDPQFNGMWSSYAFFPSGNIVASGIEQGLYVLKPSFDLATACAPDANAPPVVNITAPADGSSHELGPTINFTATATDAEDPADPTIVWNSSADGQIGEGASIFKALSLGPHTITASATDSGGATGADSIAVTVTPVGGSTDMHVYRMTGAVFSQGAKRWTGQVLIDIRQLGGPGVDGVTVAGSWSGAAKGSGSCLTGLAGNCAVTKSGKLGQAMTFTVTDVTHGSLTYVPAADNETAETIPAP